jgi:hypothetical protein
VQARFTAEGVSTARAKRASLPASGARARWSLQALRKLPPYLAQLSRARQLKGYATSTRSLAVAERRARKIIAADRSEELERIAEWCRQRLRG